MNSNSYCLFSQKLIRDLSRNGITPKETYVSINLEVGKKANCKVWYLNFFSFCIIGKFTLLLMF